MYRLQSLCELSAPEGSRGDHRKATAALTPPAGGLGTSADPPVRPAAAMNAELVSKYGEHPVAAGVAQSGMVYVTANAETWIFTVLLRCPAGTSCILVAGRGWAQHEPAKPGRET